VLTEERALSDETSADRQDEQTATEENGEDLFLSPDDSSEVEVVVVEGEASDADTDAGPDADEASEVEVLEAEVVEEEAEPAGASAAEVERLEEDLARTRERLEEVERERDEFKNRMMRAAADLENFRRRSKRELEEAQKYGINPMVKDLLPQLDNLDRALEHVDNAADPGSVVDGVKMVHRGLMGALEKHGVQGFDAVGEKFDPQRHEALQQVESSEHETNEIVSQFQKGYFVHERLVRPALVAVAKRVEPAPAEEAPEEASGEEASAQEQHSEHGEEGDGAPVVREESSPHGAEPHASSEEVAAPEDEDAASE
jgi:molecular chaperone GrpE